MKISELNGTYRGKVVDGGLAKAGNGNEQVAMLCELGGDGPEKGLQLTYYGSFSERAADITIKALRTAGWTGVDLAEVDDWKKNVPNPPEVEFVIEQEEQQDQQGNVATDDQGNPLMRTRVRWINAAGGLGVKERLSATEAQSFAQKMKGKLLAFDQNNRAPKTNGAAPRATQRPSPPKPAASTGTDDIPF